MDVHFLMYEKGELWGRGPKKDTTSLYGMKYNDIKKPADPDWDLPVMNDE